MELLLISGLSGSGKNVVLGTLEDAGYYPVNNLPPPLLIETAQYLARAGRNRVTIALDVKTGPGLPDLAAYIATLRAAGWTVRFLFLDARTATLVKRFSETRRRHPFSSDARTLTEAIEHERSILADVRALGFVFDTSDLPAAALRRWIRDYVSTAAGELTLLLESFGFKHGVPLDADLVFDVRCLPNPHYEPDLAPQTGHDAPVVAFLEAVPEVERMYTDIYSFVAGWLPDYARDNRNYLTVAIGCTGGRHRSVYLVERLARAFTLRYQVLVRHRELD
ncbi:MAG: RNase adapter RapZ [Casimicrobiaceae bacterium]